MIAYVEAVIQLLQFLLFDLNNFNTEFSFPIFYRNDQNNVGARLYALLYLIAECLVFILKFNYEIVAAVYRLIVRPELKDLRGETVLVRVCPIFSQKLYH